ncbi:Pectin lyase [Paramyrothecium foliicola]|nr:Pectin lyase [Paramyrothecium foliicola]
MLISYPTRLDDWTFLNIMKLLFTLISVAFFGPSAATPVANNARHAGKCGQQSKQCCRYRDKDFRTGWDNNRHEYKHCHTIHVKSGKKIQAAIDSASRGDKIIVAAGTYAEQLTIDKDGIQLIGQGAILVPPTEPVQNTCSGLSGPDTQAGICVTGSGVELTDFKNEHRAFLSVKRPVKDVSITGFKVQRFSGINIAVVGSKNAHVAKNTLIDGQQYGALALGSIKTVLEENEVTSSTLGPIGICSDNQSGALVSKNHVSNQFVGLCVQTDKADIQYNTVSTSCFGVFVDPGVDGAKVRHNHISGTNPICGQFGLNVGIIVDGATNTKVLDNVVEGQRLDGKGAGIAVVDDPCTEMPLSLSCILLGHGAVASGNVVLRNTLRDNDAPLYFNTTGQNNVVDCNYF